jgi:hypothetical protein
MNLIDRMITRIQRPVSPVEPLLTQLYMPGRGGIVERELTSTFAIESGRHVDRDLNQPNVSRPLAQKTQDALDSQPFRQSIRQQPTNAPHRDSLSDPVTAKSPAPALLPKIERLPFTISQLYEGDSRLTEPNQTTQNTTKQMPDIHENEQSNLTNPRLATLVSQNELTRRTERSLDQGSAQNQLRLVPTTEVNISIGHIEVRAIQRAEPIRRSASPSHVTLDDYLRRRPEASR